MIMRRKLPAALQAGSLKVAYILDCGLVLQREMATPIWGRDQTGTTVTINDILVGDVWLLSVQSNMETKAPNFYNKTCLPAAIFRSDDWEWSDGWDRRSDGKEIEQLRATCRDRGILPTYAK